MSLLSTTTGFAIISHRPSLCLLFPFFLLAFAAIAFARFTDTPPYNRHGSQIILRNTILGRKKRVEMHALLEWTTLLLLLWSIDSYTVFFSYFFTTTHHYNYNSYWYNNRQWTHTPSFLCWRILNNNNNNNNNIMLYFVYYYFVLF